MSTFFKMWTKFENHEQFRNHDQNLGFQNIFLKTKYKNKTEIYQMKEKEKEVRYGFRQPTGTRRKRKLFYLLESDEAKKRPDSKTEDLGAQSCVCRSRQKDWQQASHDPMFPWSNSPKTLLIVVHKWDAPRSSSRGG